jgi:PAS domain S-box-containing protein
MAENLKNDRSSGSSAEAEALFASIGDGAIFTDSMARISRVNNAALKILGYSEKETIGKWFPELVPAKDEQGNMLSSLDRPIAQSFLSGRTVSTRAYYKKKDGDWIPVFLSVSPVLLDGKPIGAIEVFRDISQELSLERAKDEFVAIASHQLRTPATAVKQYVGLLLEGYADPLTKDQKLFLEKAYESNERQLQIVQEILKITQLDLEKVILKPEKNDVVEVVRDAISTVSSYFDSKKQKLNLIEPRSPVIAFFDKNQIRTALENLLENASNYTWEGKGISVKVSGSKDKIKIAIQDQGVGISSDDMAQLFKKFSRIPNPLSLNVSGTGLGLYWAAKIVELHGGKISVSSSPNKGSTFTVILPKNH